MQAAGFLPAAPQTSHAKRRFGPHTVCVTPCARHSEPFGVCHVWPRALPQARGIFWTMLWPGQRATGQSVHAGFAPGEWHQCKMGVIYFHFGVAAGLTDVGYPQQPVPMGRAHCCCLLSSMAGGDTTQDWLNLVVQAC